MYFNGYHFKGLTCFTGKYDCCFCPVFLFKMFNLMYKANELECVVLRFELISILSSFRHRKSLLDHPELKLKISAKYVMTLSVELQANSLMLNVSAGNRSSKMVNRECFFHCFELVSLLKWLYLGPCFKL
jgi:hypothetical protein